MAREHKRDEQSDDMTQESVVNVIDLLKEDHRKVKGLFEQFKAADRSSRQSIADEALQDLEIHTKIEDSIVYPAIRDAIEEEETVDEAREEHHVVGLLIKELRKMKATADGYHAKFTVLSELVEHHIEEEENEMLPEAEENLDLEDLGKQAMEMKTRLSSSRKRSSSGRRKAA
jgi:hemerythrin-like domain-containing protein